MVHLVTIDSLPFVFDSQLHDLTHEFGRYFITTSPPKDMESDVVRGCWSSDSSSDKNEKLTYLEMKHVYDVIEKVLSCRDKDLCMLMEWTPMLPMNDPCLHSLAQDIMDHLLSPIVDHHWHLGLKSNPNYSLQRAFQEESDIYMSHIMGLCDRLTSLKVYTTGTRSFKIDKHLVDYIHDDWSVSRSVSNQIRKWIERWISEYSTSPG
jgi:hypothetical protein